MSLTGRGTAIDIGLRALCKKVIDVTPVYSSSWLLAGTKGMKRKQFSEEQIIGILKEAEPDAVVTVFGASMDVKRDLLCLEGQVRRAEDNRREAAVALDEGNERLKRLPQTRCSTMQV